ncbi:MAG: ATP-binding protein [bacterium]
MANERDYIYNMQRKENQCKIYISRADQEYEINGFHTKEEGRLIQEAAKLQYEMAQISDGEERKYHQRRQKELTARMEEICRDVSPDIYMQILEERKRKNQAAARYEKKPAAEPKKASGGSASSSDEVVSDDTVSQWFREAPKHSFADVAGMNELKEELKECVTDVRMSKIRTYLKMSPMHSYFFIGPPGCGKTYIIEAFAHELMEKNFKYLSLDGSSIMSRYVGDAEKIIARLFEEAEKCAPCIVFIDEIDGVCRNRSDEIPVWAASMTTAFLTAYNRIHSSDKQIIFIGATNYPNKVDNAMMDRVQLIKVPFPDEGARSHAFSLQFSGFLQLEDDFSFEDMAALTNEYNYRDIDRLSERVKVLVMKDAMDLYGCDEEAAVKAMESGEYRLTRELFETAQAGYNPTPKDEIKAELAAWEERFESMKEQQG